MARIGAQIAVAQIGRGEKRRTAGEIENDAASGPHAIARGSERQHAARASSRLRKIVDRYVEGTEMSCRRSDLAFYDRKIGDPRRRTGCRPPDHSSGIEMLCDADAR